MSSTPIPLDEARERIAQKGRDLLEEGLVQRTSGNVSIRVDDDRIAISPSAVPYHEIEPRDIPIVNLDGNGVDGGREPSSETPMHVAVYRHRSEVGGVIHTHSPFATTFSSLGQPIEPSHYLIAFAGKEVPVAPYARNGTEELAKNAVESMGTSNAVLLRNHGVLAVGSTLEESHNVASHVEYVAQIHWQASLLGDPELIEDDELEDLHDYFQDYQ